MILGEPHQIAFDLRWFPSDPPGVAGLAWGGVRLWVGGRLVWSGEGHGPVCWTWVDLLEHLARAWGHLLYEENAPYGIVAVEPERLADPSLVERAVGASAASVSEAMWAYQHRHDLAAGLRGIHLPSVWVLPAGRELRLRVAGRDTVLARQVVVGVLEAFAGAVCARLEGGSAPRAEEAVRRWQRREPTVDRRRAWRSGLPAGALEAWAPAGADAIAWWGADSDESPLMAAARLSEGLDTAARQALVRALAEVPLRATPELDALTAEVRPIADMLAGRQPHVQGQEIALWLRARLGFDGARCDPEALLRGWGVLVGELPPTDARLDAVACWSGGRGPAVLVNPQGTHARAAAGRRATLAHEVAHLLLDRGHQLPAAEVLGGATPAHLEQRARAFAAELLLPRDLAGRELARHADLDVVLARLAADFGVSREVVGWQIRNGPGWESLGRAARAKVARWCGVWRMSAP